MMPTRYQLQGRSAVVLGTGPAIGRACVTPAAGVSALARAVDATVRADVRSALAGVAQAQGGVDVLVNIVGGSRWSLAGETSDEEWDLVMRINLRQQWVVAQEVLPYMIRAGHGSIVAIASVSGLSGSTRHGAYGAAKAGLINLVRTLAVEYAPQNIRVNAIAPGTIVTPARAADEGRAANVPLGRRGQPEDIGNAATFLSSAAAGYITGQVLVVDGGVTARHSLVDLD